MVIRLVDREARVRDERAARADEGGHLPIIINTGGARGDIN
jgi:hypothetical protein